MVKLDTIYTRGGDQGQTSLVDGARVAKHCARMVAIGAVEEAGAAIGVARLYSKDDILKRVQNELFDLGADLATPSDGSKNDGALRMSAAQVAALEADIDSANAKLDTLTSFVLAGGAPLSAHLHMARTIVRRAERDMVALMSEQAINDQALAYINRLSDLLFVLARQANDNGRADVLWQPGASR